MNEGRLQRKSFGPLTSNLSTITMTSSPATWAPGIIATFWAMLAAMVMVFFKIAETILRLWCFGALAEDWESVEAVERLSWGLDFCTTVRSVLACSVPKDEDTWVEVLEELSARLELLLILKSANLNLNEVSLWVVVSLDLRKKRLKWVLLDI
jgi:hypothetical protein